MRVSTLVPTAEGGANYAAGLAPPNVAPGDDTPARPSPSPGVEVEPALTLSALPAVAPERSGFAPVTSPPTPPAAPARLGHATAEQATPGTDAVAPGLLSLLIAGALAFFAPWLLYRRLRRDHVFANATREAVFARVASAPGQTTERIARSLGLNRRTAEHHLRVLHELGAIEARTVGARAYFFQNGGTFTDTQKRLVAATRSGAASKVLAALSREPGGGPSAISRATGLPKSTVRDQLLRFRRLGVEGNGDFSP